MAVTELVSDLMRIFDSRRQVEMSLDDYLIGCRKDPMMYASAAERLLAAIGEPHLHRTPPGGDRKCLEGDRIPRPQGGSGGGSRAGWKSWKPACSSWSAAAR